MDATLGRQFFAQKGPGKVLRDELTATYPAVTIDRDREALNPRAQLGGASAAAAPEPSTQKAHAVARDSTSAFSRSRSSVMRLLIAPRIMGIISLNRKLPA